MESTSIYHQDNNQAAIQSKMRRITKKNISTMVFLGVGMSNSPITIWRMRAAAGKIQSAFRRNIYHCFKINLELDQNLSKATNHQKHKLFTNLE